MWRQAVPRSYTQSKFTLVRGAEGEYVAGHPHLQYITGIFGGKNKRKRYNNNLTHQNLVWRERSGTKGAEVQKSIKVWGSLTLSVQELEGGARSSGQSSHAPRPRL